MSHKILMKLKNSALIQNETFSNHSAYVILVYIQYATFFCSPWKCLFIMVCHKCPPLLSAGAQGEKFENKKSIQILLLDFFTFIEVSSYISIEPKFRKEYQHFTFRLWNTNFLDYSVPINKKLLLGKHKNSYGPENKIF